MAAVALGDQLDALLFGIAQDVSLGRGAANELHLGANDLLKLLGGKLDFADAAADPAAAGEIRRNVADVKVFSGGAIRNLSDVGAGPTEANKANMEAEDTGALFVPPDLVKNSPGVSKGW